MMSRNSFVAPSATLGVGVFVAPKALVHSFASVDDHSIINTAAIIEHECIIGENMEFIKFHNDTVAAHLKKSPYLPVPYEEGFELNEPLAV